MATASGTLFGTSSGLFGTPSTGTPAFGTSSTAVQPASSGFTFGAAKTTTNASGFSFAGSVAQPSSTGFGLASFGSKPTATASAFSVTKTSSQQIGFGSLSTTTSVTTSSSLFGSNLFGAQTATSASTAPFQFQASSGGTQGLSLFGNTAGSTTSLPVASSTVATGQKVPENPKDAQVAAPLMQAYEELSKHIKEQRAKKDEITRYSAKLIFKANEDILALKQLVAEVSNGMQRDAVGVEALKSDISQELSFAEIAKRLHEGPASMHIDYTAPMEYFQWLVVTFESRIKEYKQQLDELEMYLSTPAQAEHFSPQDLFSVLQQLNDTFMALAAQLHGIHETVQALKRRYLNYRAVVLNDTSDVFAKKQRAANRESVIEGSGPSPFAGLAGPSAVAMAAALNQPNTGTQNSTLLGSFGVSKIPPTSTTKSGSSFGSTGLSRSLSFTALSSRGAGTSLSLGSSLTGAAFGDFASSSSKTPQFQLQNPPGTKRGKKD